MIDLDRDLEEARAILEGRSMMQPTVAHLRALQVHFEDTLIVLAMKAAKFHDDIMAISRRQTHLYGIFCPGRHGRGLARPDGPYRHSTTLSRRAVG